MKGKNAKRLLNKIMGWKLPKDEDAGYADLETLAKFGYDDYQQFKPGMRFIESLAMWLLNFPPDKRKAAYDFVRDKVLYISRQQMEHAVSTAYQDFVIPELLKRVSVDSIHEWNIKKLYESDDFKILRDQTLFLGLSDGSHIDYFRRSNAAIDYEQVSRTHEINSLRAREISSKLESRLKKFENKNPVKYFRNVFLLDDFSASGKTYLNENLKKHSGVKGKIRIFLDSITDENDPLHELVNTRDLHVYLILYFATENAINNIRTIGQNIFDEIPFDVIPIQTIPDSIKFDETANSDFTSLVKNKKYGWDKLKNEHLDQGSTNKPYLGFDGGGLPLILYHNTPNNSLPILHRDDPDKTPFRGLFPRVDRHK